MHRHLDVHWLDFRPGGIPPHDFLLGCQSPTPTGWLRLLVHTCNLGEHAVHGFQKIMVHEPSSLMFIVLIKWYCMRIPKVSSWVALAGLVVRTCKAVGHIHNTLRHIPQ